MFVLKSTGQEVFVLPWIGEKGGSPLKKQQRRILVPFADGQKHGLYRATAVTVHKDKLITK